MNYLVRELRDATGLTQEKFADRFGIPLSTLRKWEQGEASPAPYVVNLIAAALPASNRQLEQIQGLDGQMYFYDPAAKKVLDSLGNSVIVKEDLAEVKMQNLRLYVQELFDGFYRIQEKFNRDCQYDKEENILWTR